MGGGRNERVKFLVCALVSEMEVFGRGVGKGRREKRESIS